MSKDSPSIFERMRAAKLEEMKEFEESAEFQEIREQFPVGSWIYIPEVKQLSVVKEVKMSADGPAIKTTSAGMYSIKIDNIRPATGEEIIEWQKERN